MQQSSVKQGLLTSLIVLVVIAGGFLAWEYLLKDDGPVAVSFSEEDWYGELLVPPQPAPKFELIDQYERPFRLQDQEGNVVVLFFGYTNCPDICPATLLYYTRVKRELGVLAEDVRFVFVTVDPEHDTPEHLERFVGRFDPSFYGLTGDPDEISQVARDYGVYVERMEDNTSPTGYWIVHGTLSYVIDSEGNLRLAHPFGVKPEHIAEDLRKLL